MELKDAIAFLTTYNRWRRGEDETLDMPNPREIGIALDTVLAAVIEGGTGNSGVERPEPSPHFLQKGTPETDAAEMPIDRVDTAASRPCCIVNADFARKLEHERDEARELHRKSLREREATEKEVDAMLVRALKAERERDEARQQERIHYDNLHEAQAGYAKAERAEKMLRTAAAKADQWRECAEGLILYAREAREALNKAAADKWVLELQRLNADIARYERLKEGGK
jgi:hypothetical protein